MKRNEQLPGYERVWRKHKKEVRKKKLKKLIKAEVVTALMVGAGASIYSIVAFSAPEKPQRQVPEPVVMTNTAYKVKPVEVVSVPYTVTRKVMATPVETAPVETTSAVKSESNSKRAISEAEFEYIVKTVWAESGNQDELGQRYVTDCIINRKKKYKCKNYYDVIQAKNAFATYSNGMIERAEPTELTYKVVKEELEHRTNTEILYFRTKHYHKFGTPCFKHGAHYFSK